MPYRSPELMDESGYATVTAIVLCAAISVLCAGILGLTLGTKRQAQREMFHAQESEAINTAVLHFSTELIRAQGDATLTKDEAVTWPGGRLKVKVRGEYEGRKWPVAKAGGVDEAILATYSSVPKQNLIEDLSAVKVTDLPPRNDCVRTLFSPYGNANPNKALPQGIGLIASAGGHDGQVWRIRATTSSKVEERYIRITGDSSHLFAIISQEELAKTRMPDCQALNMLP